MLRKKRYEWAYSASRREHWIRKALGVLLIAVSIYLLLRGGGGSWRAKGLEYLWFAATLLWILGWLFHLLEKWLYPEGH